jgi:hypothetical protein
VPGATATLKLCGVAPVGEVTESQVVVPETPLATAVKVSGAPLLVTLRVCAGVVPPVVKENVIEVGDALSVAVTVKVTGTVRMPLVLPQEVVGWHVKTTVPLYVPVAKPVPETDTVSVPCVAPLAGVADSQLPPVVVTLYEIGVAGMELVIVRVWDAGGEAGLYAKVSELRFDCSDGSDVSFRVTLTGMVVPPTATLIVPV